MVEDKKIEYEISFSAESKEKLQLDEAKIEENRKLIEFLTKEIEKIQNGNSKENKKTVTKKKSEDKKENKEKNETLTEGEKLIRDLDSKGLQNLRTMTTSPEQLVSANFLSFLGKSGPQGILIATLITTALSSPETLSQIVRALAAPGGPLERDWKRFFEKQIDIGLSRIQLERRQVGADILVLPQKLGFVQSNEAWASSNLFAIDAKKVARIGLTDKEEGLFE